MFSSPNGGGNKSGGLALSRFVRGKKLDGNGAFAAHSGLNSPDLGVSPDVVAQDVVHWLPGTRCKGMGPSRSMEIDASKALGGDKLSMYVYTSGIRALYGIPEGSSTP